MLKTLAKKLKGEIPQLHRTDRWLMSPAVTILKLAALCTLAGAPFPAAAQVHEQNFGRYVIRASVVHSSMLTKSVLEKHGLASHPRRAFLNVVVLWADAARRETAPATVIATVREPSGYTRDIDLRAVTEGGRVSWIGPIPISASHSTLEFTVTALAEATTALKMRFTERVYQREDPS
jgi:hypothetical protein